MMTFKRHLSAHKPIADWNISYFHFIQPRYYYNFSSVNHIFEFILIINKNSFIIFDGNWSSVIISLKFCQYESEMCHSFNKFSDLMNAIWKLQLKLSKLIAFCRIASSISNAVGNVTKNFCLENFNVLLELLNTLLCLYYLLVGIVVSTS